jgi:hypothetical protein
MGYFKIPDTQHAKTIKDFNNAKLKLLKTNAANWFDKICRINRLTPKYVKIKTKGNNRQKMSFQSLYSCNFRT